MDFNTIAIIIALATLVVGFASIVGAIIAVGIILSRQSSRQDDAIAGLRADNAALNAKVDNLGESLRAEMRELGYRIENRINLDERVRDVEQRTAPQSEDEPSPTAAD